MLYTSGKKMPLHFQLCRRSDNNRSGSNVLRILYFWSPLAVLITTFDSLFISVVDEISGEDTVRSGFDCSNERGFDGAIIFYIAICSVFSISSCVLVVFMIINEREILSKDSSNERENLPKDSSNERENLPKDSSNERENSPKNLSQKWGYCFAYLWYIVHFPLIGIVFIITGLMFIAADNNWPWICLAKNDSNICSWVIVRVGLLAVVTVFSILFFLSSAALSLLQCGVKLVGNSNQAETSKKSDHTNEGPIDRGGAAIEQTNTAASGTDMPKQNTPEEENTMDDTITKAESEC